MTQQPPVPAGWYPDPSAPPHLRAQRYWDGVRWTEHAAPAAPPAYRPAEPATPDGVPLGDPLMRVVAYIVDNLVVSVTSVVLAIPFIVMAFRAYLDFTDDLSRLTSAGAGPATTSRLGDLEVHFLTSLILPFVGYLVVGLVVELGYSVVALRWRSTTVGLRVVGMQVRLREQPGRLSWGTAFRRVGAQFLPLHVPFVGTVWLIVDLVKAHGDAENRQTLHDRFPGTSVVKVSTG